MFRKLYQGVIKYYEKINKKILIRKYVTIAVSLVAIILMVISVYINIINVQQKKKEEFHTVFKHTSYVLNNIEKEAEYNQELFIDSYLSRAKKIAYVLSKYTIDDNLISELLELSDITTINLVSEEGIITDSSNKDSIGLSFHDYEKLNVFLPLIASEDQEAYYVQFDGYDFVTKEDMIYLGVKPYNSIKGMIQIEIKPEILLALQSGVSISNIYTNMPVSTDETHFILDESTGEILGITGFSETSIQIENEKNKDLDMVSLIKKCQDGKFIKVNGLWSYVYSQEYEGYILSAYVDGVELLKSSLVTIVLNVGSIFIMTILLIQLLNVLINKYFLVEVQRLVENIHKVIQGDFETSFTTSSKTEFSEITEGLNKLVGSFKNHSKRMNKIIQVIHYNVGIFEYLKEINNLSITNNIKELLDLDDEQWENFKKNNDQFMNYLTSLNSVVVYGTNNVYLISNSRYIQIDIYQESNLSYGVIKDITREVIEKRVMIEKLKDAEIKMSTDKLTGLKNIHYVKKTINELLTNVQEKGLFIIFDLDNFKRVNDSIGHPEGDKLLQKFANCLKTNFRSDDIIARLGGDEFVVFIFGESSIEDLKHKLDSFVNYVHKELEEYYIKFQLSVSIGVASTSNTCSDYETLYHNADSALYIAKRDGKDRYYINPDGFTRTHIVSDDYEEACDCNG